MANFTFPFSSTSANFQPPFCSLPVSFGVAHPAPSLNPILQQASISPDPILQEAISQAQAQVQATLQAQALLQAHAQAHSNAIAHVHARGQELVSASRLPAGPVLPSGAPLSFHQLPNTPPAAGLAAPGMFLPLAHTQLAAFVVGPGFLPVPSKTVTNIISGQYIDLATLLAKPSDMRSPSPLIYIDGQVVVSQASKPARRLTDIAQWLQAFAIYMLIMVIYLPSRAADLIRYQLLILRMYTHFGGLAWYNYDEAFRRDAAARHVVDWSGMHVELYNFHTSASTRVPQPSLAPLSRESIGASFGTTICRSWNLGCCVAARAVCRYLHVCDVSRCRGPHRRIHCPNQLSGPAASVYSPTPSPNILPPLPASQRPRDR